MTYYNEQDLRDELTDILLEECKHRDTVKEDNNAYCVTCEAYTNYAIVSGEDGGFEEEYGDWETRPEILNDIPTGELVERAKEAQL